MVSRILIFAPNWLGDAVMALPSIQAVRRRFDRSVLAVAARASVAPLFSRVSGVDAVLELGGGASRGRALDADVAQIRKLDAGVAILLPNSFRSAWVARRAGIGERWGYSADLRGWLLTRGVRRPRRPVHQAEYYQALVRALGIETGTLHARLLPLPDDLSRARALLEAAGIEPGMPVAGFAPGAAYGHAKRWAPSRVAEVIARLTDGGQAACVLVGSSGDESAGREIDRILASRGWSRARSSRYANLIGRTDLPALFGVIANCRAFVSNDSGAMHLAAALGVPVTAIFGPTDERATAPLPADPPRRLNVGPEQPQSTSSPVTIVTTAAWCRPCLLRECPTDHRCMTGIRADSVYDSVCRQLGAVGSAGVIGEG
jgi:heptosyltransferase II